ncbi:MAG: ribbon-helix-helix protein, CopG family [Acidobacteria bacterium]|nr:MAG: ribbon-helix-helix protein, CopG family [Acidobacteriota bacterium]
MGSTAKRGGRAVRTAGRASRAVANRPRQKTRRGSSNAGAARFTVDDPREAPRPSMIVQVVLDDKLLQAANLEARRTKRNRSALIREALREYLRRQQIKAWEDQEREGYKRIPEDIEEAKFWESQAVSED